MNVRRVNITPRLKAALDMLEGFRVVADIGCDHGRLTAALLQRNICSGVIASDISEPSLEKAKRLIEYIGLTDSVSFRVGDGCTVLQPGECDALALLGMGGTLMCRILDECTVPLMGAKAVVLQPMRAQNDIRSHLFQRKYRIVDDRVVLDHGRYYQVLKAVKDNVFDTVPDGFPADFYDVGYRSFALRDELLPSLCREQLNFHEKMLLSASGTDGEAILRRKIVALQTIIDAMETGGNK